MSSSLRMAISLSQVCVPLGCFRHPFTLSSSLRSISSLQTLGESVRTAVDAKTYQQIPDLLNKFGKPCNNANPFSCLSTFPENHRIQIIDELLQSFVPFRPRSRLGVVYSCLLSYTLQGPSPLPLALAILQRTLRSGCVPVPQTNLLLSTAWIDRRAQSQSVPSILKEMQSLGYYPDCGTCNYLISSLCAIDQLEEAINILDGMGKAGCVPDLDSYGAVIGTMCARRRTSDAARKMKEMVANFGLTPRQETVVKVIGSMQANKEMSKAVGLIEFLESEGFRVGFESYELVVKGCLERRQFILAAKAVMGMTGQGFIPYISTRQKLVEGLVSVDELKLASAVRQRFAELRS